MKAGLATASQAKKAEKQAQAEQHARKRGKSAKGKPSAAKPPDPGAAESARTRAALQQAEKRAKDKAIAHAANEKAAAKALRAELRQLILQNDQRSKEANDDDVPYNFVHGKKIKKIHVPKAQMEQLSRGTLVIVNNDGLYHLVPSEVAERIRARDPKRIIAAHQASEPEPGSDDEYYAQFKIPDDLDW